MRDIVASIEGEYLRYKKLGEASMAQLADEELSRPGPGGGNSIAIIVAHLAGNLRSRFTDFLTADGEKPWRDREGEFASRTLPRAELIALWDEGWRVLLETLAALTDADLPRTVTIRGQGLTVHAALHRSLAHAGYHVGQIVYLAKGFRGPAWRSLSIPPGGSAAYNRNPTHERPRDHAAGMGPKPTA